MAATIAYVLAGFVFWGFYLVVTEEDPTLSNMAVSVALWPLWVAMTIGAVATHNLSRRGK